MSLGNTLLSLFAIVPWMGSCAGNVLSMDPMQSSARKHVNTIEREKNIIIPSASTGVTGLSTGILVQELMPDIIAGISWQDCISLYHNPIINNFHYYLIPRIKSNYPVVAAREISKMYLSENQMEVVEDIPNGCAICGEEATLINPVARQRSNGLNHSCKRCEHFFEEHFVKFDYWPDNFPAHKEWCPNPVRYNCEDKIIPDRNHLLARKSCLRCRYMRCIGVQAYYRGHLYVGNNDRP